MFGGIDSIQLHVKSSSMNCRYPVAGLPVDFVDYEMAYESVLRWRQLGSRGYVCLTNPHSVMMCHRDPQMRQATSNAGLILPDGVGMVLAARLLGWPCRGRVSGPTLMLKICDWGRRHGLRHYLLGGKPGVPEQLATRLHSEYPGIKIVGTCSPPFRSLAPEEDAELCEMINRAQPDIVWIGLGAPKQEKWMADHADQVRATAMIAVGAAFDFHAGTVPWAPAWMRKCGLEWLHRLYQQPLRMWRRNLDSFRFMGLIFFQYIQRS